MREDHKGLIDEEDIKKRWKEYFRACEKWGVSKEKSG